MNQGSSLYLLTLLEAEITYRLRLSKVLNPNLHPHERVSEYQKAEEELNDFDQNLPRLISSDNVKAARLYLQFVKKDADPDGDIVATVSELKQHIEKEKSKFDEKRRLEDALGKVADQLAKASMASAPMWSSITPYLAEWQHSSSAPTFVYKLLSLDRVMLQGMSLVALDAAEGVHTALAGAQASRANVAATAGNLRDLIHILGFDYLEKLVTATPRWPFKVANGIKFGERIKATVFFAGLKKGAIEDCLDELRSYRDLKTELCRNAELSEPSDVWIPENMANPAIDSSLKRAIERQIELFDPAPGLSDPEITVERLLAARQSKKWIELQKSLELLEVEAGQLAENAKTLGLRIAFVRSTIGPSNQASQNVATAIASQATVASDETAPSSSKSPEEHSESEQVIRGESAEQQTAPPEDSEELRNLESLERGAPQSSKKMNSQLHQRALLWAALVVLGVVAVASLIYLMASGATGPIYGTVAGILDSNQATDLRFNPSSLNLSELPGDHSQISVIVLNAKNKPIANAEVVVELSGQGELVSVSEKTTTTNNAPNPRGINLSTDVQGEAKFVYRAGATGDQIIASSGNVTETFQVTGRMPTVAPREPTATPVIVARPPQLALSIELISSDGQVVTELLPGHSYQYKFTLTNQGGPAEEVTVTCSPLPFVSFNESETSQDAIEIGHWPLLDSNPQPAIYLPFTLRQDAPTDKQQVLECQLTAGKISSTIPALPFTVATPEPRIMIDTIPGNLTIGIGQAGDIKIRVVDAAMGGAPQAGEKIISGIDPVGLVTAQLDELVTDQNGEAQVAVTAGESVGTGKIVFQTSSGEWHEVSLNILPVLNIPANSSANSRTSPEIDVNNLVNGVEKGKTYAIVGKTNDADFEWWQIRLSDNQMAWVAAVDGVTVNGDTSNVSDTWQVASLTPTAPASVNESAVPETTPTPRTASPEAGRYQLVAAPGASSIVLRRIDTAIPAEILTMGPGGQILIQSTGISAPPDAQGTVKVWVRRQYAQTPNRLNLPRTDAEACWEVTANGDTSGCGILNAGQQPYPIGEYRSDEARGDWVPAVLNVWVPIANVGDKTS